MIQLSPQSSFYQRGQAAVVAAVLMTALAIVITLNITNLSIRNVLSFRRSVESVQSYYLAEGGIEDSLLRLINSDYSYQANNTYVLNGHTTTITIDEVGETATITSESDVDNLIRTASTALEKNTVGASFFYGVQVDDGGLDMRNEASIDGSVYSNGNIIGTNTASITGDAIVSGGIDNDPAVEWTAANADQLFATASSDRDIAQSFTANEDGSLAQVTVYLGKVGTPTNDLTLHLTNDNGGQPATSSLANATIARSTVSTTPDWITASFDSAPNVSNGNKYWIVLDYGSNSGTNHWNWRKDSTGGYPNNTGSYTSNWSSGSATWTSVNGDLAFQVWIGGEAKRIEGMTIGDADSGSGHANLFVNDTIHGSACPNAYCLIENPGRQELPLPEETITGWKDDAAAGGERGTLILDDTDAETLGPIKINGDLTVQNSARLTLTGTVWVTGDITLENNAVLELDDGFGTQSGILMGDGHIGVKNDFKICGSVGYNVVTETCNDSNGSYVLVLSDKVSADSSDIAITMENDSDLQGVIYASRGYLHVKNHADLKEATAYGMIIENHAVVSYESGLQNLNFSSGPSGGWTFNYWREID